MFRNMIMLMILMSLVGTKLNQSPTMVQVIVLYSTSQSRYGEPNYHMNTFAVLVFNISDLT